MISYIKWFRSPPRGKRTDGFYRRESNLWKNQDVWETAKVLGLRNAASKHLAVNQCHPFRRNPSSHFYEDYFLQCIPYSAPSPADKDSSKDHFGKPHRTHGTGAATAGPGTGARVTPGTTVSLPAPDSRFPASVTTFSFSPCPSESPAATPRDAGELPPPRSRGLRRRGHPSARHCRSLPALPFSRAAVATPHAPSDLPQRVPSASPPSPSLCLPPRLPERPRLPTHSGEQAGAQLRGGAGGGLRGPPAVPAATTAEGTRGSPPPRRAVLSRLPVPPGGGGD